MTGAAAQMDIVSAREAHRRGKADAQGWMEQASHTAAGTPSVYMRMFDGAMDTASRADRRRGTPAGLAALEGIPVSVKDLFDVAGRPTTASSLVLQDAAAAARDSACVHRLRRAGAVLAGHTVMTEFAYSGLGLNPWFGTPANPVTRSLDGNTRIPGGSSSGAAVSVASGSAFAALGTDTGGSLRIPAALCGLVGFKPTQRLTAREGMLPLSESLDAPGAITRSVRDAVLLHEVLADVRVQRTGRSRTGFRLWAPGAPFTDSTDRHVAASFERALRLLQGCGMRLEERRLPGLESFDTPRQLAAIVAAEAYHLHAGPLAERAASYDPRVAARIMKGKDVDERSLRDLREWRRKWSGDVARALEGFDAVVVPTVPVIAPELQPLERDDDLFAATNLLMLRNPAVVNHLDGCAISIPCQRPGEYPAGVMLFAPGGSDDLLLELALHVESVLRPREG